MREAGSGRRTTPAPVGREAAMSDVRWVVCVPDPVLGLVPWRDARGQELELRAPDRATATAYAKRHFIPPAAVLVSRLELDAMRAEAKPKGAPARQPVRAPVRRGP